MRSLAQDALAAIEERADLRAFRVSDVIFKIVTLFLVFMGVLAMFGKLRFPGADAPGLGQVPEMRALPDRQGPLCLRQKGLPR